MKYEEEHIDHWMQEASAAGQAPLQEADWQHMKALLQPEKKRRFIFWWWWPVGLVCLLWLSHWLLTNNHNETKNTTTQKKQLTDTTHSNTTHATTYEETTKTDHNNSGLKKQKEPASKAKAITSTTSNAHMPLHQTSTTSTLKKKNSTIITATIAPEHALASIKNKEQKKSSPRKASALQLKAKQSFQQDKITAASMANEQQEKNNRATETAIQHNLNHTAVPATNSPIHAKPAVLQDSAAAIKDSSSQKTVIKDSTSNASKDSSLSKQPTKNIKNKKIQPFISVGYQTSNKQIIQNSPQAQLGLQWHIWKGLQLQAGLQISAYQPNFADTVGSIKSISPILGTTNLGVYQETYIGKPTKGFSLQSEISLHYRFKKWVIGYGIAWSKVYNQGSNQIGKDSIFFTVPNSSTLKIDNNSLSKDNFTGKQTQWQLIALQYSIRRKWLLGVKYYKNTYFNTLPTVVNSSIDQQRFTFDLKFIF